MIVSDSTEIRAVTEIPEEDIQRICDFLQGAVYSWCKNRPGEWFALRDLMGGENFFWEGTPLIQLYQKHERVAEDPINSAAIDGGWILKRVIHSDVRKFESEVKNLVRHYRWLDDGVE